MRILRILPVATFLLVLCGNVSATVQLSPQDQALFNAVRGIGPGTVNNALQHGANIEARNSSGQTPLINCAASAAWNDKAVEIVRVLLENHAQIEAKDNAGFTPLIYGAQSGNVDMVKLLLENHANIEAKDNNGETPLFWATYRGNAEVVKVLLESHANIEAKGGLFAMTPLIEAATEKNVEVIRLLLENHANIEAKDNSGMTPLIWASAEGNAEVVKLLLKSQANIEAKDTDGRTALDVAAQSLKCDTVAVLEPGSQQKTAACLQALLAKYQQAPTDDLAMTAIRTAEAMNPPPPIPEEARSLYVQGNVMVKSAQGPDDIKSAVKMYEDAVRKCPWFADAWYNLSLVREKAGDFKGAKVALGYVMQLQPQLAKDRTTLDHLYALDAEDAMAKKKQESEEQLRSAVSTISDLIGGKTMYRFWVFSSEANSLAPISIDNGLAGSGYAFDSWNSGGMLGNGHDGISVGSAANVTSESGQVVLTLGTDRFCIPANAAGNIDNTIYWGTPSNLHITDCGQPAREVYNFGICNTLEASCRGGDGKSIPTTSGTVQVNIEQCDPENCRRPDIAIYWYKP